MRITGPASSVNQLSDLSQLCCRVPFVTAGWPFRLGQLGIVQVNDLLGDSVQPYVMDKDKRNGAHFAAAKGELEVLQLLHSKGVDMDAEDVLGRTPIHYAALHDHESIVSFLVLKSAWLDACDGTDCTALHLAARGGAAAAARRLVKLGAKINLRNQWDLTPFGEIPPAPDMDVLELLKCNGTNASEVTYPRGGICILFHAV